MVPVCGGILRAAVSDAAPAGCGSEFKSGLSPTAHDKDPGRVDLPIAETCLRGHRVRECAEYREPPGTGSTHRRWTGKIHTVDLGFATKYEELCCADIAQRLQAQAPELSASRVLPRSLGVPFHRVLQARLAPADSLAEYLSLFPFHSRRPRVPRSETTCEGC